MRREIRPIWLLRQASELARSPRKAGQPRNCDLRRATSAAYYAVFHTLTLGAARHLLPVASTEDRYRLARSFDHGSIAEICRWLTGTSAPSSSSPVRGIIAPLKANQKLTDLAAAFLILQQHRHKADYDHLADFSRPKALANITLAEQAVAGLGDLCGSEDGQTFFVLVAMRKALR